MLQKVRTLFLIWAGLSLFALSSCQVPTGTLPDSLKELNKRLNVALQAMLGNYELPGGRGALKSGNQQSTAPTPEQEKNQLLHEMFQVVLLREPVNDQEFAGYLNALIQGASLEGIYNGFVNSDYYKSIEDRSPPAEASAVHIFSLVISTFQHELGDVKSTSVKPTDLGVPAPYAMAGYEKIFSSVSLYKLKRILAAEALKVIAAKHETSSLGPWYSNFAALMAGQGVDFGLQLRNRSDAAFHLQWYKGLKPEDSLDRVTWEVLNRVHRLLNFSEKKVAVRPSASAVSAPQAMAPRAAPSSSAGGEKKAGENWEIIRE